jgi:hypothetical protein
MEDAVTGKTQEKPEAAPENAERMRKGRFGEQPQPNDKSEEAEPEKDAVEDAVVTGNALHRPPG